MLARRGWSVTVFEKGTNPTDYDPGRGFMYLIDGRGQRCLEELGLMEELKAASVLAEELQIGVLTPMGLQERVVPLKDASQASYWLPRHVFVGLLLSAVRKEERVRLLLQSAPENFQWGEGQISVRSAASSAAGSLLIGADGVRSAVRAQMEEWDGCKGAFVPTEFSSPAANLRYKVLTLPGAFSVTTPQGPRDFVSEAIYSVRSASHGPRMGLLPTSSRHGLRTANVITKPDNSFWDISTATELKAFAEEHWPHFPISELVSEAELTRFAADRGGRFPKPQHPTSAAVAKGSAGAVVIGDALHTFPPDIGQGVNSALEDVLVLCEALDTKANAADAARGFEKRRMPDVKALVQLVRVSAPYQYSQSQWGRRLWTLGFLVRLALSKVLPGVFQPSSFLLVQRSELSYSEVWSRGRKGAQRAWLLVATLGAAGLLAVLV